jgi:hypothetical protein
LKQAEASVTIEIRELVIRASVNPNAGNDVLSSQTLDELRQQIVEECLDRVLEKLSLTESR